ncbi:hypothetical protein [Flavobacterium eburneipallidum]|uniref:hypothetical protein n=1 Tax=Flavobacterium eburneipallidum TaxID=3003263 RepID=UPI00248210AE|nr:hypothetical protein [Flavobacterium eburneipallidum]
MKPMNLILIGALIVIFGGILGAIGSWRQNKSSSEKSSRIETGVNKGLTIGETTNQELLKLRKENKKLIYQSTELNKKNDVQINTIEALRKENIELYSKLASSSLEIYNNLTGGDSYCYCFILMSTYYKSKDIGNFSFILGPDNKSPLKNIQARIFDLNTYDKENPPTPDDPPVDKFINLESLEIGNISKVSSDKFHLDKKKGVNLNIFFYANNGEFTQLLRMRFVNDEWTTATIVKRHGIIIFKKIDKNYPEKNFDKIFK